MANLLPVIGSEQSGECPVLILQNDTGNKFSPTTIVAAITSKTDKNPQQPTHIMLHGSGLLVDSMVMLEQIRTLDKKRLGRYIGQVQDEEMKQVENAILSCLDIKADV